MKRFIAILMSGAVALLPLCAEAAKKEKAAAGKKDTAKAEAAKKEDAKAEEARKAKEAVEAAATNDVSGTEGKQEYLLICLIDSEGARTFQVSSKEEYRQLAHDTSAYNKALPEAYNNLRRKWRESESKTQRKTIRSGRGRRTVNVKIPAPPFPLERPEPKAVRQMGTFPSLQKLNEKKAELESREAARAARMGDGGLSGAVPVKRAASVKPATLQKLVKDLEAEVDRIIADNEASSGGLKKVDPK